MKGSKCVADYFTSSNRRILTASQEINMRTDDDEDKMLSCIGRKVHTDIPATKARKRGR
jgi:hypothetical protein